jgi:uncharacterized membrane protein YphA (DoxX/SURF4 family)
MHTLRTKLPAVVRVLLGLVFFVFGLNGFLHFLPQPPMPGPAGELLGAFGAAGYMFPLIKGTEVLCGALLLGGRFVPLALTMLAPVVVNIFAFHLVLAPAGLALPIVVVGCEIYLAWAYREAFRPLLQANAKPASVAPEAATREARAAA